MSNQTSYINNGALGSNGGSLYGTLSSNNGVQEGQNVTHQINSYISPYTPQYYSPSNINPETGIPFGANGSPSFYVDQYNNWHYGDQQNQPAGGNNNAGGGSTPQPSGGGNAPAPNQPPAPPGFNLQQVPQYNGTPEGNQYLNSLNNYQSQLNGLMSSVDQNYNAELAQINAQMGMLKNDQATENDLYARGVKQAGLASGMSEITPEIMKGEVHQVVTEGIQKLTNLTIKQNGLILDARKANITQKMDILKQLKDIDAEKFKTARQMKEDFYNNIKQQDELVKSKVGEALPAIYSEIQSLSPEEKKARLQFYANQMGVPASKFTSLFKEYDDEEQKPIRDMRAKLMEMAPDIGWSMADLTASPQEFQKKLSSSPYFKAQIYAQSLDNAYKQASIDKMKAEAGGTGPMIMSGLNFGKSVGFMPKGNLTADQTKVLDAVNNSGEIIKQAQNLWKQAYSSRPGGALRRTIGGLTQSRFLDQDYKQYYDHVHGVASILAKVYGNTGNPSDRDIKNAVGLFPDKYDTEASAQKKWQNLYDTSMNRLSNLGDVYIVQ